MADYSKGKFVQYKTGTYAPGHPNNTGEAPAGGGGDPAPSGSDFVTFDHLQTDTMLINATVAGGEAIFADYAPTLNGATAVEFWLSGDAQNFIIDGNTGEISMNGGTLPASVTLTVNAQMDDGNIATTTVTFDFV